MALRFVDKTRRDDFFFEKEKITDDNDAPAVARCSRSALKQFRGIQKGESEEQKGNSGRRQFGQNQDQLLYETRPLSSVSTYLEA